MMANFEIKNKVALVTGGGSGLGFQFALGLLEKGARGVALADVNSSVGNLAVTEIEGKYGKNKAIFVKTDVTNYEQFEGAFKKTVEVYKNIDILINNAGIANDRTWQREVAINVNGTIHGILLGLETYLPKYKSGSEGLIVNISSVLGISPIASFPIYVGTKFAIHGMTLSWGLPAHYDRTKVRLVGVCPGMTITQILADLPNKSLGSAYEKITEDEMSDTCFFPAQEPEQVAPGVMQIIEKAASGTMWVVEGGAPPYQFTMPNRFEISKINVQ